MIDDDEFVLFLKCVCVLLCVIVVSIAACTAYSNYLDYQLKTDAMQAGYEQRIENNFLIWTKTNIEKAEQQ